MSADKDQLPASSGKDQPAADLSSIPVRGRRTVRAATVFAVCEVVLGTLLAASRSARGDFYIALFDEWPVWAAALQIIAMPLLVWLLGWPGTWKQRGLLVAINAGLAGFAVLGFCHLVEFFLYRMLELFLRLLIPAAWLFAVTGVVPVVIGIARRRKTRGEKKPFLVGRLWFACVIGVALSESTCGWLLRQERILTFPDQLPASPENELHLVAIGGSSMLGHPYEPKYGIAEVAAWRLRQLYPDRIVRLTNLAIGGLNLREAMGRLHRLETRPDLLLVYSGHNEFFRDLEDAERTAESPFRVLDPLLMNSPTFVLTYRLLSHRAAVKELKKDLAKNINLSGSTLIRDHIVPVSIYQERLVRFRTHLSQLGEYCRRENIATIWFVPAGNEADWDPNRSSLSTFQTAEAERQLQGQYQKANQLEAAGAFTAAISIYERGLQKHPELAEFHYRLGQCLLKLDRDEEAAHHLRRALDTDGHPIRANADYRKIITEVARESGVPLIDSPSHLRRHTARGILDRTLFHDNVHPTLKTLFLLGTAACETIETDSGLQAQMGMPETLAAPDFEQSLADAGITADDISLACARIAFGVRWLTRCRFDATWRLHQAEQFQLWSDKLKTGEMKPGDVGVEPLPKPRRTATRARDQ